MKVFGKHRTPYRRSECICICKCTQGVRLDWEPPYPWAPPAPRVAAVKKLYLVHCEKCRRFFVKFLAAIFHGIEGRKSAKMFAESSLHLSPGSCKTFDRTSLWGIAGITNPTELYAHWTVRLGIAPVCLYSLTHQDSTTAIASNFRIDGAKSPEIPQKKRGFGLRNHSSKSQIVSDLPSRP